MELTFFTEGYTCEVAPSRVNLRRPMLRWIWSDY